MHFKLPILFLLPIVVYTSPTTHPQHQYPLTRRGESFPAPDVANLTYLLSVLDTITTRFNATILSSIHSQPNTPIRKPRRLHGTQASSILLGDVGLDGSWFANLHIGTPAQEVDMDLDMLAPDWWILSTGSRLGSWFLDFNSRTYRDSEKGLQFPTCREPSEVLHLPGKKEMEKDVRISFAHCRPVKYWIRTLLPSGAHLGLAPGLSLGQTRTKSLLGQLLEKAIIDTATFSLKVLNGTQGVMTVGRVLQTDQHIVDDTKDKEAVKFQELTELFEVKETHDTQRNLESAHLSMKEDSQARYDKEIKHQETRRGNMTKRLATPVLKSNKEVQDPNRTWVDVQGPEGWWQTTMSAVWVGGRKVLQPQAIVLDINTPFILAPAEAAQALYASISGSRRLPVPFDQFHAYPCLSPPQIYFEFGQDWKVQVLKGKRDKGTFSPGGRFSLGRMTSGSGYCVGIVVESRMGVKSLEAGDDTGLEDLWVLGEPFFSDCEVAFDVSVPG